MNLRPPGYEPPRFGTGVPPHSAGTHALSQIGARPLHLGGIRWHRCGTRMLAERLQRRVDLQVDAFDLGRRHGLGQQVGRLRERRRASPRTRRPDPCERPTSLLPMLPCSSPVSTGASPSPEIATDCRRRSLRRLTTRNADNLVRTPATGQPRARRLVLRRRARRASARIARAAFLPGPPVTPPPGCVPAPHM